MAKICGALSPKSSFYLDIIIIGVLNQRFFDKNVTILGNAFFNKAKKFNREKIHNQFLS